MEKKSTVSRRRFLAQSAGLLAAPVIIPGTALGKNGATAASERLSIVCIGLRNMGNNHFKTLLGNKGVQLAAICDVDRKIRDPRVKQANDTYAKRYGKASWTSVASVNDFREIVARDDVDAVVVATPDHTHAIITVAALKSGKDVYVEKPMTVCIREGRIMADMAERYGRVLQVGSQRRSSSTIRRACEMVQNGRIGKLQRIEVGCGSRPRKPMPWKPEPIPEGFDYDLWLGPAPWAPYTRNRCHYNFRFLREYSGGEMTNFGAHFLDVAQWGAGMDSSGPVSVEGKGKTHPTGLYTVFYEFDVRYTYANGVELHCTSGGHKCKFIGTEGWIDDHGRGQPADRFKEGLGPNDTHLYRASGGHMGTFLKCMRTRERTAATAEIGHRSATVCHLGNIAMTLQRKLTWDPVKEEFPNDDEANRMTWRPYREPWGLA